MAGYFAKKRLGQHFLTSEKIVKRMVELIGPKADQTIIEVGPGRGVLTLPLAESGANLWGIEFDRDLIRGLERMLDPYKNATLLSKDFLAFHPEDYDLQSFVLVGNLPYNITSPIIDWCIRYRDRIQMAVFMVQREVAWRITGSPGSKDWSPIGIFTQLYFDATYCFDVPPHAFMPPPEVDSAVIKLEPWPVAPKVDVDKMEKVVRAAFTQRRKTLLNNLVPGLVADNTRAKMIFAELGLTERSRAEELTIAQFAKLSELLIPTVTKPS